MWELICDHYYCWGKIAGDRSPWRPASDGFVAGGVDLTPDGFGLRFPGPASRISIKQTEPWLVLGGVRVEITTRLQSYHGYLIDGESFSMHVNRGLLIASGTGRDVINTYSSALGPPLNKWVRFTFEHNGFNQMALFIDDALAATRGIVNPVAGVGPKGVAIGNALHSNNGYLDGDIERVQVWRIDPRAMEREFLARPLTPELAECWTRFIRAINAALAAHPKCAHWLVDTIGQVWKSFLAALAQKSQAKLDEFNQLCAQYRALWRAGLIDDPAMQALLAAVRDWLIKEGVIVPNDPIWQQIAKHECMQLLLKVLPAMDCDPEVHVILRAIAGDDRPPQDPNGPREPNRPKDSQRPASAKKPIGPKKPKGRKTLQSN